MCIKAIGPNLRGNQDRLGMMNQPHLKAIEGRVAKMVKEDEPTTPRDPSVWELATRDDEPVEARFSVKENEPTERKIAREHEPATSRWARENEQPRG